MGFEMRYGSHSKDGKIWSFNNREGVRLKGDKDWRVSIDTPFDIINWEVGKKQYTCEVGIIPDARDNLAKCLGKNYGENLRTFFKTPEEKFPEWHDWPALE